MTTNTPPADPDEQLALWRRAVEALGGQHAMAQRLDMHPRSINRLYAGKIALHEGTLAATSRELTEHAALCRELDRQLSPAFTGNLTERQRKGDMRGRVRPGREPADG